MLIGIVKDAKRKNGKQNLFYEKSVYQIKEARLSQKKN